MANSDIEQVLRNWIDQATSPLGKFAEGVDPAAWVAEHFIGWWREQVADSLSSAESASQRLRDELNRVADPEHLGEAFHELTHVQDALGDLRADLGLIEPTESDG